MSNIDCGTLSNVDPNEEEDLPAGGPFSANPDYNIPDECELNPQRGRSR